jgi:hypothetical protein
LGAFRFAVVAAVTFALGLAAVAVSPSCTPKIGDKCVVSTDCSVQGDRLCDTSQPGGYCTQLNCRGNDCFDEATCVLFNSAIPGCLYDDRSGGYGSRVARSFCMAQCETNADCRGDYVCADPRSAPWSAVILDNNQDKKGCLPQPLAFDAGPDAGPDSGVTFAAESAICQSAAPMSMEAGSPVDAAAANIVEAGTVTLPPLFPNDASADAGTSDAGSDAGDGG